MIDVNICLSPTVIRKYLWFNIHMDLYLPITFWYIIYIQKQYLCWIFVSLKMFTPNLQYSYQTGLEWLKEGVKSIFLNDSRSFWSTHVQEDNKPALENHICCRLMFIPCPSFPQILQVLALCFPFEILLRLSPIIVFTFSSSSCKSPGPKCVSATIGSLLISGVELSSLHQ